MAQIIENIHHGQTRKEQILDIGNASPTREHVAQILAGSPYNSNRAADDSVISKILAGLLMSGKAEHGWARYTLHNEI